MQLDYLHNKEVRLQQTLYICNNIFYPEKNYSYKPYCYPGFHTGRLLLCNASFSIRIKRTNESCNPEPDYI